MMRPSVTCFTYKTSFPVGSVCVHVFNDQSASCALIWKRLINGKMLCEFRIIFNKMPLLQEQLEHAEVSTALRYLGQYYFKNKLYDEASLCAQRCCDYNDVSAPV